MALYNAQVILKSPGAGCAAPPIPASVVFGPGTSLYSYSSGTAPAGSSAGCGSRIYGTVDVGHGAIQADISGLPFVLVDAGTNTWKSLDLTPDYDAPTFVRVLGSLQIDDDGDGYPYAIPLDLVDTP